MAAPCFAGLIVANNAGSVPSLAQDLTGVSPTEITGSLSGTDLNDVDMFKIYNVQPSNFSAISKAILFGIPDTVLSLFDSTGVGLCLNDDISGANTLSSLPLGNPFLTTGGFYYLAISRSANYPVDANSNEIFIPLSSTDLVGPSSTNPVVGWDGGAFTTSNFDLVNYDILLTGAAPVPEPGTWLLTGAGLVFVWCFRHPVLLRGHRKA